MQVQSTCATNKPVQDDAVTEPTPDPQEPHVGVAGSSQSTDPCEKLTSCMTRLGALSYALTALAQAVAESRAAQAALLPTFPPFSEQERTLRQTLEKLVCPASKSADFRQSSEAAGMPSTDHHDQGASACVNSFDNVCVLSNLATSTMLFWVRLLVDDDMLCDVMH
jgi:hypothetical protein